MLGVVAAFPVEVGALLARRRWERREEGGVRLYRQSEGGLLVAVAGMGREGAERAVRLLAGYRPTGLLSTGFAVALDRTLSPGTVVVPERVSSLDGDGLRPGLALGADPLLLEVCRRAPGATLQVVSEGVTVPRVLVSPEEKRRLGRLTGAAIADMESFWTGALAAAMGIPFLAVRAVFDTPYDALPPVLGRPLRGAPGWATLRWALPRPLWWPRLWRWWGVARRARTALGEAIAALAVAWEGRRGAA
jgi:nucleoside phosphorylase